MCKVIRISKECGLGWGRDCGVTGDRSYGQAVAAHPRPAGLGSGGANASQVSVARVRRRVGIPGERG